MSQNISWLGNDYSDVPFVSLPKTGGGAARFDDASITTASASDVASGKIFLTSDGKITTGTASGGGGGSQAYTDYAKAELSAAGNSITYTNLLGEPTSFIIMCESDLATGASPYKVASVVYDGTDLHGQIITNTSNAQVTYDDTSFSMSYSSGTLTVTSTSPYFQANAYGLQYTYGGTANVHTEDVQVGSGATSIAFTGLVDEPIVWWVFFKSNFATSSGYQRVICVLGVGGEEYGMCMDSSAHYHADDGTWDGTYSNGTLTITSSGTNAGGYFHQPGYYELVYVVEEASPYQKKSVSYTPTTSTQTQKIEADNGYDALAEVNVTVEAVPTMTLPSASSSTSSGTSKATITPSSSAQYLNIPTGYNATAQYYTIAASGGGGSASIDTKTVTASNRPSSLSFSSMKGEPIAWCLKATFTMSSSNTTYYYVDSMRYNGTNTQGRYFQMGSTRQTVHVTSGYSYTYSNGTLTVSSTGNRTTAPGCFYNGTYELVYVY